MSSESPLRVAWLGPLPTDGGGVPTMAATVLTGLAGRGVELEAFLVGDLSSVAPSVRAAPGITTHELASPWKFDRWYSRTDLAKHIGGMGAQVALMQQIGVRVLARHRVRPFDVVYQFSTLDSFVRVGRPELPPLVLHPEVHALEELRWSWRERRLMRTGSRPRMLATASVVLALRAGLQRALAPRAARVIAPSSTFAAWLQRDAGVDGSCIDVVPNPIDLGHFTPSLPTREPREILVIARIAVRKGLEDVVALSHRLADLAGEVRITVVGERSLWSDYRPLMQQLHPLTGRWLGQVRHQELSPLLSGASLLLQPSRYEPFALSVSEALACGVPVIASPAVGAIEGIHPAVARAVRPGDVEGLEQAVRGLLRELDVPAREEELRRTARLEAERAFAPATVTAEVHASLARAAAQRSLAAVKPISAGPRPRRESASPSS